MDSTKYVLNKLNKLFENEDDKENKKFLEKGISLEDKDKISDNPETVGELVDILSNLPRETKISYSWAGLNLILEEDEVRLLVSEW